MKTTHTTFKTAFALITVIALTSTASSVPELDAVSFDPAFISAGDRVNISANIHETQTVETEWDSEKTLKVVLKPGNRLTEKYVTIEDERDESIGFLYPDGVWNQRFQVKVDSGAPTGGYKFELHIQYLEEGQPVDLSSGEEKKLTFIEEFAMPVDREGVDITGDVTRTSPTVPRPGDNYVEIDFSVANTGNKPLEEIELKPETPELVDTSFSKDEKFFIDRLEEGISSSRTLSVNLGEKLEAGRHMVNLSAVYEDVGGNAYSEKISLPLRVEGKPDLELTGAEKTMMAGEDSSVRITVKNTGEQDAESVTARLISERTQPFSLEDRSNYIGEIESGEKSEAVMKISSDRSAVMKTHRLKIRLRSNGDSEEGDHSVYTFTEDKEIRIEGRTRSSMIYLGVIAALLVLGGGIYRHFKNQRRENGGDRN